MVSQPMVQIPIPPSISLGQPNRYSKKDFAKATVVIIICSNFGTHHAILIARFQEDSP